MDATKLAQLTAEIENINKNQSAVTSEKEMELGLTAAIALEKGDIVTAAESIAELGDSQGMFLAGYFYSSGDGVEKNEQKGLYWMQKAAESGNVEAMFCYGGMLFKGAGGNQTNFPQAFAWFKKSAENGDVSGMLTTGIFYLNGQGVMQNRQEAFRWLLQAAEQGNDDAMVIIAKELQESDDPDTQMHAFKLYMEASKSGNTEAINGVGFMLYQGIKDYLPQDLEKAKVCFETAANMGHIKAMKNFAILSGNEGDRAAYEYWYKKAAQEGDEEAVAEVQSWSQNNKDGGFCFITTAVCQTFGKPDDCYELTMFRNFRDTWLIKQPDGKALISEYYAIAPTIVERINRCNDAAQIYKSIWRKYLAPCLNFIEIGDNASCKNLYIEMVKTLKKFTERSSFS